MGLSNPAAVAYATVVREGKNIWARSGCSITYCESDFLHLILSMTFFASMTAAVFCNLTNSLMLLMLCL
jgi:hypothetical protein